MIWPFSQFRKPRSPQRGTIEAIYGMIVAQAREPVFYRDFAVPDTVNGRFDMLLMQLWMALRRLKPIDPALAQDVFDHFVSDMDHNLREMGTGDLAVPKKMREFGGAFYGRAAAYDIALAAGQEALALALSKNIYNGSNLPDARRLAVTVEAAIAALAALDDNTLRSGAWRFPSPAPAAVTGSTE
jgi:cytochrome b pre-mRNA-processing protein 3